MAETYSLAGLRVLVTRPEAQATALCQQLRERGAQVVVQPLQKIEPLNTPARAVQLRARHGARAWIFTSANAVHAARDLDQGRWPTCIAVGGGTAQALEHRAGIQALVPEKQFDSEGVLALPALQDIDGKDIALITGEGGRGLLDATLTARGARLTRIEVYRRVGIQYSTAQWTQAFDGLDALIITNGEALTQMMQQLNPAQRAYVRRLQLVVPSARVVEHARQLSFMRAPRVAEPISDHGYVRALEAWWHP